MNDIERLNSYCEATELIEHSDLTLNEFAALCHLAAVTVPRLNALPFPEGKVGSELLQTLHQKGYVDYGEIVSLTHKAAVFLGLRGLPHPSVERRKTPLDILFGGGKR